MNVNFALKYRRSHTIILQASYNFYQHKGTNYNHIRIYGNKKTSLGLEFQFNFFSVLVSKLKILNSKGFYHSSNLDNLFKK
jgi:hypothetical protein